MLTITLKSGEKKVFNFKSFEREKALKDAWYAMHGDPKYASKRFRIGTREGDSFELGIDDITDIKHEEAEYYRVNPSDVVTGSDPVDDAETANKFLEAAKKERQRKFIDELDKRGVHPNFSDPFFLRMLQKVVDDTSDLKIPIYANMYANTVKGART